jgi:hypothetical protein
MLDGKSTLTAGVMFCTFVVLIAFMSSSALYNATLWYFSSNYFNCAAKLKFVSMQQVVPAGLLARLEFLFWGLLGLNIGIPVLTGICSVAMDIKYYHTQ